MKHFILMDSNFIVATIDKNDAFHKNAVYMFNEIIKHEERIKIIIPPLGLYEFIVTLKRKGFSNTTINNQVMKLICLDYVIVASITDISAFKHCKSSLIASSQSSSLRTNDFLIVSLAIDYQALILTFDQKVINKIKPIYSDIYYCSDIGNAKDESLEFLQLLDYYIDSMVDISE